MNDQKAPRAGAGHHQAPRAGAGHLDAPDEANEWKRRAIAIPVAMLLALGFHAWGTGHFMQRTALTMPLHELGHAITGWFCGFTALPTFWKTLIPEVRGTIAPVAVALGAGYLVVTGWQAQQIWRWALGLAIGVAGLAGMLGISVATAQVAITFGGDGGAMVLGTVFMLAFLVGPESRLRAGGLRYGLLAIGAAAFVDTFSTWWSARTNEDAIPFGEIEGVGLSDPSKLQDVFGWATRTIVDRYVTLGSLCLIVLAAAWLWSIRSARRGEGAP